MATASSAPFTVQTVVVANHPPVWSPVPSFVFAQGIASSISVADYVTDADGDALTINMSAGSLPTGATYAAANKRFVYDGSRLAVVGGQDVAGAGTDGHRPVRDKQRVRRVVGNPDR